MSRTGGALARFRFPDDVRREAVEEAKRILGGRARRQQTITYTDLVRELSAMEPQAHDPRLNLLLGEVSSEEEAAGRGMLSVLVVYKGGESTPGPGFFELAEQLGRDVSDRERFWINQYQKVCAAWSA